MAFLEWLLCPIAVVGGCERVRWRSCLYTDKMSAIDLVWIRRCFISFCQGVPMTISIKVLLRHLCRRAVFLCFLASFSVTASELYEQSAAQAKQLLKKAVSYYRENGNSAFPAFSRQGDFVSEDFYVFVLTPEGVMIASGGPSYAMIGQNVKTKLAPDIQAAFTEKVGSLTEADGIQEAEYFWQDWSSPGEQRKRVFFQRVDDLIFAVGFFVTRGSEAQAQALLDEAVQHVAEDPKAFLASINQGNPNFLPDDLYVYVVNRETGRFVAHGYNRRMIGADFSTLRDPSGKPVGRPMLDMADAQEGGRHTYIWFNPITHLVETKKALFQTVGKYLVAVGYYVPPEDID